MLILQGNYCPYAENKERKLFARASASSSVCFFTEARDFACAKICLVSARVLSWLTTLLLFFCVSCICRVCSARRRASSAACSACRRHASSAACSACRRRAAAWGSICNSRVLFSKLLSPPPRRRLLRLLLFLRAVFLFAIIYSTYILFIGHNDATPHNHVRSICPASTQPHYPKPIPGFRLLQVASS